VKILLLVERLNLSLVVLKVIAFKTGGGGKDNRSRGQICLGIKKPITWVTGIGVLLLAGVAAKHFNIWGKLKQFWDSKPSSPKKNDLQSALEQLKSGKLRTVPIITDEIKSLCQKGGTEAQQEAQELLDKLQTMLIRFVDKEEKKMKTLDDARVVLKKPRRHDRGGIRPLSRAISTYHNS
jgi:hypothetical protein